jgi:hypothetical protein
MWIIKKIPYISFLQILTQKFHKNLSTFSSFKLIVAWVKGTLFAGTTIVCGSVASTSYVVVKMQHLCDLLSWSWQDKRRVVCV